MQCRGRRYNTKTKAHSPNDTCKRHSQSCDTVNQMQRVAGGTVNETACVKDFEMFG